MSNATDEAKIRAVIDTWMKATAAGDLDAVLQLMADDVVFLRPEQPPMRGRDAYAAQSRGAIGQMTFEGHADVKEIQVSGDLAYCWTSLALKIIPADGSAPHQREGNVLTVFRRERDGRWVVFRDANFVT